MKIISKVIFLSALVFSLFMIGNTYAQSLPSGCVSNNGYSSTTGVPCNGATTIPAGCTTTAGFSTSTGSPCNGYTKEANGYNGSIVVNINNGVYINGCTSLSGFSTTTGYSCNMSIPGVTLGPVYTPPVTTPGLPTTGAGGNALVNLIAILSASVLAVFSGVQYAKNRKIYSSR